MSTVARIVMDEALLVLSEKHNYSVDEIRRAILDGHEELTKQFNDLVYVGYQTACEVINELGVNRGKS